MDIFQSIILGIVQGLTEFIPVSSSGHLELLPKVLSFNEPSTEYIIFLHFGTLVALVIYFRKKILSLIKSSINYLKGNRDSIVKSDINLIKLLVIATIPAGIIGLILENTIENFYDSSANSTVAALLTIIPLIVVGVFFLFTDKLFKNSTKDLESLNVNKSLTIGFAQALALIRGVSRSGITLISGQALGLSRVAAAEFGFLMSIPIVTATSLLSIYTIISGKLELSSNDTLIYIVGFLSAFISGFLAIKFLLSFLKKNGLRVFGIYRIIIGLILLIVIF